jgi:hypothetical protein
MVVDRLAAGVVASEASGSVEDGEAAVRVSAAINRTATSRCVARSIRRDENIPFA